MKNSILTILAVAAMVACNKTETTAIDSNTDSMAIVTDSGNDMVVVDSTMMSTGGMAVASMNTQDKMFTDKAATGGMMEVMMGELAATKAMNDKVKALGKMMVEDHGKVNAELKTWAEKVAYTLPNALNSDQRKMYDDLKMKNGADFDKAYSDLMVSDHKEDIADFKKQAADGGDADLKAFAMKIVPTLENHLKMAEEAMVAVK